MSSRGRWLDIHPDELEKLLAKYFKWAEDGWNIETLKTLNAYLENNMNYGLNADKLFAHINTIRKRIERAELLIGIEWKTMSRDLVWWFCYSTWI